MERLAEIRNGSTQITLVFSLLMKETNSCLASVRVRSSVSIKTLEAIEKIWSEMLGGAKYYMELKAGATTRPLSPFVYR